MFPPSDASDGSDPSHRGVCSLLHGQMVPHRRAACRIHVCRMRKNKFSFTRARGRQERRLQAQPTGPSWPKLPLAAYFPAAAASARMLYGCNVPRAAVNHHRYRTIRARCSPFKGGQHHDIAHLVPSSRPTTLSRFASVCVSSGIHLYHTIRIVNVLRERAKVPDFSDHFHRNGQGPAAMRRPHHADIYTAAAAAAFVCGERALSVRGR